MDHGYINNFQEKVNQNLHTFAYEFIQMTAIYMYQTYSQTVPEDSYTVNTQMPQLDCLGVSLNL